MTTIRILDIVNLCLVKRTTEIDSHITGLKIILLNFMSFTIAFPNVFSNAISFNVGVFPFRGFVGLHIDLKGWVQ
jgi:hypothetical protein